MRISNILRQEGNHTETRLLFYCPGCKMVHSVRTWHEKNAGPMWTYNANPAKPTFNPSIVVQLSTTDKCHSFVRDGKIEYLGDSFHHLKGKTVDIPEFRWGPDDRDEDDQVTEVV